MTSVQDSCSVLSNSVQPHGLKHSSSLSITNTQSLLKLMSITLAMPFNHLILCHPLLSCVHSFPASGSFQMSWFFTSGAQIIGVSASASFLPVNIQDWFPLGWTGWISLQSKGLSRVFSNTTVRSINSMVLSFLYSPTLTSKHDTEKTMIWLDGPLLVNVAAF